MQTGTQILIERMKTNPEEFSGIGSKWANVLSIAEEYLPEEDKKALNEAYQQMRIDHFNEEVLKTLAGEREEQTLTYKAKGRYATGFTDPRGFLSGSNGVDRVLMGQTQPSAFGAVPVKEEGKRVKV